MKFKNYSSLEEAIKEQYFDLYWIARKYLKNKSVVEDVLQEVLVKSLIYKLFNPGRMVSTYIIYRKIIRECFRANKTGTY